MKIFATLILLVLTCNIYSQEYKDLIPLPKAYFERSGTFVVQPEIQIAYASKTNQSSGERKAIEYLKSNFQKYLSIKFLEVEFKDIDKTKSTIYISIKNTNQFFDNFTTKQKPSTFQTINEKEGYCLDIDFNEIVISGVDEAGLMNAASTLIQLIDKTSNVTKVKSGNIIDYPKYQDRWIFSQHNLRGANAMTQLEQLADTMVYRKLNGIQQNDWKYNALKDQPKYYFDSVTRFKNYFINRNIEIIPGLAGIGWSDGILYNDPNLAEGLKTSVDYIIEKDTARLITDPKAVLNNGGFETIGGNGKFSDWSWYDEQYVSQDKTVFHSGSASALCTNFDGGNCRFNKSITFQKDRGYLLSAWVKTENFKGDDLRLFAYAKEDDGNYRAITFTSIGVANTSKNWVKLEVTFNSLKYTSINLYVGVWGANQGKLWIDDIELKDIGLTNILRRSGTPLTVVNKVTKVNMTENNDFEKVEDKLLSSNYGPYHQAPTFKIKQGGLIKNGDILTISSYHPFTAVSDENGNGSVMVCVSEDTLYKILNSQMKDLYNLYSYKKGLFGQDEIRNMNWDDACLSRALSPADLLGENITKCYNIAKSINKDIETFMWSDMVDSLHNAYKDYYLINGDLKGVWNKIPKDITIVNWNSKMVASLKFFDNLGFSQVSSPYYDVKNTVNIRSWRIAQEKFNKIKGMMYTTWGGDYDFLTPFSYYAWGAGPNYNFTPLDILESKNDTLHFNLNILKDPYDINDKIDSSRLYIQYTLAGSLKIEEFKLNANSNIFNINILNKYKDLNINYINYKFKSTNVQGITNYSPNYILYFPTKSIINNNISEFKIKPNPAKEYIEICSLNIYNYHYELIDLNSNIILNGNLDKETNKIYLDNVASGIYIINIISNGININSEKIIITK
ncbi:MAG: hypothetical protein NTW25_15130 [Candidatus Kapabacteria bacterium]|nr:hypothetical protein [Candidatus Kapabacteria bacterium]